MSDFPLSHLCLAAIGALASACFSPNDGSEPLGETSSTAGVDSSTSAAVTGPGTTGDSVTRQTGESSVSTDGTTDTGVDDTTGAADSGGSSTGSEPASCETTSAQKDMACIPGGPFLMGSLPGMGFPDDEQLQHTVTLSPYFIDITEVTVAAYGECVAATECAPPGDCSENWGVPGRLQHPVDCVFHSDVEAYGAWVGKQLPTEEQWERAARGTKRARFPWGETAPACEFANIYADGAVGCGTGATAVVGSYPVGDTDEGVSDMTGNVAEWVAGFYDPIYYEGTTTALLASLDRLHIVSNLCLLFSTST